MPTGLEELAKRKVKEEKEQEEKVKAAEERVAASKDEEEEMTEAQLEQVSTYEVNSTHNVCFLLPICLMM